MDNLFKVTQYLPHIETNQILKLTGCALIGFSVVYCGKIWYSYRLFKKIGLQTPNYKFFFGNFPELLEKVC
jgi:hypothetical protein